MNMMNKFGVTMNYVKIRIHDSNLSYNLYDQ